jgi:hypothetical protein
MLSSPVGRAALAYVLLFVAVGTVNAQNVSYVRANSIEIGPFIGLSYGLDATRVLAGGNITYALKNRYVLPYFEYSYFPGFVHRETDTVHDPIYGDVPFSSSTRIPFSDVHGGVHIRFPIRESPLVPYAVVGLGALIYQSRTVTFGPNPDFPNVPAPPPINVESSSDFAVNFGGGLRYYFGQKWGVRVEAKAYKATGRFTDWFGKAELGVFYQIR